MNAQRVAMLIGLVTIGIPAIASAATPPPQSSSSVVRITPATRSQDLAALPNARVVEFPNGLRASMGQVRALGAAMAKARAVRPGPSVNFRSPPAGPIIEVKPGTEAQTVQNAPDNAVLQLPDGRRVSAAQFRAVQAATAKFGAADRARPASVTPAQVIKVPKGANLQDYLKRPDTDVLESPNGKRITVGQLRAHLQRGASPR